MKAICINPTKTLIQCKEYDVEEIEVKISDHHWPYKYAKRYLVKINEFLTITVKPNRFILV